MKHHLIVHPPHLFIPRDGPLMLTQSIYMFILHLRKRANRPHLLLSGLWALPPIFSPGSVAVGGWANPVYQP